ncbi:uncharacterized protein METZ01_LOCUS245467, partial [marine metagenome]
SFTVIVISPWGRSLLSAKLRMRTNTRITPVKTVMP